MSQETGLAVRCSCRHHVNSGGSGAPIATRGSNVTCYLQSGVSTTSNRPLIKGYLGVREYVTDLIDRGLYEPGDKIPSERELAAVLGVSRMTVRRALNELVSEARLERDSTNGTIVQRPPFPRTFGDHYPHGLSEILGEAGLRPGSQLLDFNELPASDKVAAVLKLAAGDPVLEIRRLRLMDGTPLCIETTVLPRRCVPTLAEEDLSRQQSLYKTLRERFGVIPTSAEKSISISYARPDEAKLLKLPPRSPVLFLRSIVVDDKGRPVEYLTSVNHPHLVAFSTSTGFW